MKKLVFSVILFTAFSATGFAQSEAKTIKKDVNGSLNPAPVVVKEKSVSAKKEELNKAQIQAKSDRDKLRAETVENAVDAKTSGSKTN